MSLDDIRQKIDELDGRLLAVLNERADLVHEVGMIKHQSGGEIYAPDREEKLLLSLVERSDGRLPEKSIRAIYREIMSASLDLEKALKIAYFGLPGSWTHQAARSKFGASVAYISQPNIAGVFDEVERGRSDYGVVPIENSTEGAVNHTLDVFMDSQLQICAQIHLKIENNLMANCTRNAIKRIYSHPRVFGQYRDYITRHFPNAELMEVSSTTQAAEMAAQEKGTAALGGRLAAEIYGLKIIEESVQSHANNTTRFLVIGQAGCPPTGNDKTSLMLTVKNQPGTLFSVIEPFRQLGINVNKIERRPSKHKAWEYVFFVDIEGHCEDKNVKEALADLARFCSQVKTLGSYPASETQ